MSSKREIKKLSRYMREELRYLQNAINRDDAYWAQTYAQQAAGLAVALEEAVFAYVLKNAPTHTTVISHVTPIR